MKFNDRGFSLIELSVGAALAVAIALGVAKTLQTANKGMAKVTSDSEFQDIKNYIKTSFTRGNNCARTFNSPNTPPHKPLTDFDLDEGTVPVDAIAIDTIVPPGMNNSDYFYEISSGAGAYDNELNIVTNTDGTFSKNNNMVTRL